MQKNPKKHSKNQNRWFYYVKIFRFNICKFDICLFNNCICHLHCCRVWAKFEEEQYWDLSWHGCLVWWEDINSQCLKTCVLRCFLGNERSLPGWYHLLGGKRDHMYIISKLFDATVFPNQSKFCKFVTINFFRPEAVLS